MKVAWLLSILFFSCNSTGQQETKPLTGQHVTRVGGPFENSEFFYIGMPDQMGPIDTSAGWEQPGQKLLITGTILQRDGITPAAGVILYYYHTDVYGLYANRAGLDQRVVRHGYIRGWVKSGPDGRYAIYTVRPAPYPNGTDPAHIHPAIKEPGIPNEYYIDEFVFDDDPLLTSAKRRAMENRGGSGVLRPGQDGSLQIAEHDIILGLNIPGYPADALNLQRLPDSGRNVPGYPDSGQVTVQSGLPQGYDQPSFTPFHAYGPDKGSRACPVCKYGKNYGILYFVGNNPDWPEIRHWLTFLEAESVKRGKQLKVYFIYGDERNFNPSHRRTQLENIGQKLQIKEVALTFVPSFTDEESEIDLCRISPKMDNTFIVYRNGSIIRNYVNLKPTEQNFQALLSVLDKQPTK